MSIMKSTQVLIALEISGNRESDLVSLLQTIVQIALLIWGFWQQVSRVRRQVRGFCLDCQQAASLAASEVSKLLTLDFSFAFGVG